MSGHKEYRLIAKALALAVLLATTAILLLGCGSGDGAGDATTTTRPVPPLEGTSWLLTSYARQGEVATPVLPDTTVSMMLEGEALSGNGGCNEYFGTYVLNGEDLTIGVEGNTNMACAPEVMLQEQLFFAALADATAWEGEGLELRLLGDAGGVVATFTEARSLPLTGTEWSLTHYLDGAQGFTTALADTRVTAVFAEDGTVSGTAGCNDYSGPYTAEGETLSVGPLANTERFCEQPEGVMDQETAYLADLQEAAAFVAQGATLTVLDGSGTKLLQYQATALPE